MPNKAGGHKVQAWAESSTGVVSTTSATYAFGYGKLGMTSPGAHPMPVTTGAVDIASSGPAAAGGTLPSAELFWRVASSGEDEETGWNKAKDLTVAADADTGGLEINGRWDTTTALRDELAQLDLDERRPVLLELQVCVAYAAGKQCTWFNAPRRVLRVPHAFGEGFPVAEAGPGQVALWTGELNTQITDVTVPGYSGDLSVSRSHSTFAGSPTTAAGVFGPGWTAQLDGPDAGAAGFEVIDNTHLDGTIIMVGPDGNAMLFGKKTGLDRRLDEIIPEGEYVGVDDETGHLGVTTKVAGSAGNTRFVFTDSDGVVTTFKTVTAPAAGEPAVFAPESVDEPGAVGKVTYSHDEAGRVTRILGALPAGMTPEQCPAPSLAEPQPEAPEDLLTAGCRALRLEYATQTTATSVQPGDVAGQAKAIHLDIYDPAKAGGAMSSITVAEYAYDSGKRLVSVTDPRSALVTRYSYDSQNRLTELGQPGLEPYLLSYDQGKLATVTRQRPGSAETATVAKVMYGVPTSGAGLPDLSDDERSTWDQTTTPTYAAAVFGPKPSHMGSDPAVVAWGNAALWYTDERGYTLNRAAHGAGDWQISHTEYDGHGHVVRELDFGDIAAVKAGQTTANQAGTLTTYNSADNGPAATPAGAVVTDTYGPTRLVLLADGNQINARPHTHTDYDQGSPNGGINPDTSAGWRLPTTVTVQAVVKRPRFSAVPIRVAALG